MPRVAFTIEHRNLDDIDVPVGIWYLAEGRLKLRFRADFDGLREHYEEDLEIRREMDDDVDSVSFLDHVARQSTHGGTRRSLVAYEETDDPEAVIDRLYQQHIGPHE